MCTCVRGIDCYCEQSKSSYNIDVYIYVHSKCMLLCSLLERESAHGEPSTAGHSPRIAAADLLSLTAGGSNLTVCNGSYNV